MLKECKCFFYLCEGGGGDTKSDFIIEPVDGFDETW